VEAQANERIIVALDVPSRQRALALARALVGHVGLLKVGLELLFSEGLGIVREIADIGASIMLDTKICDIPNTAAGAARALTRLGASMLTVHAMGGQTMLRRSIEETRDEAARLGVSPPRVLAVTILTSLDDAALANDLGVCRKLEDQVLHLSRLALDAGADGVVASAREAAAIRRLSDHLLVVTPGVRPSWSSTQDQLRVQTPGEAVRSGASHVVIGRPIIDPPASIGSPVAAAERIGAEIQDALKGPVWRS
jgi:orotidine-5'-phosphate decarboxylase